MVSFLGGGLLTAVEENLAPVLVSSPDTEILVIQTRVGSEDIRIINGYGPQEDANFQDIYNFWQDMDKEIISAKEQNCKIIIQLDANAKLGKDILPADPNDISGNGKILLEMVERHNLCILNTEEQCKGGITRHRNTVRGLEISVLDYIIVCQEMKISFQEMIIDEDRTHVLTKYASTKGREIKSESDHNILYGRFNISYRKIKCTSKREIFNFKNLECQKTFFEVTNNSTKLSQCFVKDGNNFEKQSSQFFKVLNQTFHQCFRKVRITNNPKKVDMEDELQKNLFLKTRFTDFLKYAKSDFGRGIAEQMLIKVEERISHLSAQKNKKTVTEHISNLQTLNGSFSNLGMWKLKSKLLPRPRDPPMAKKDAHGNLITSKGALKKLYLDTYVHRLRNREMKSEYSDILQLKTVLWGERFSH